MEQLTYPGNFFLACVQAIFCGYSDKLLLIMSCVVHMIANYLTGHIIK